MIVVVSSVGDDHAVAVIDRLRNADAEVRLLDLGAFPRRARVTMQYGARSGDGDRTWWTPEDGETVLGAADVVWWRRPQPFEHDPAITDPAHTAFVNSECWSAVSGLWLNLDAVWVNHPSRDEEAARKPHQLRVAPQVGFEVPQTLITNDPVAARRFVAEIGHDRTIYKAFTGTLETWRETRLLRRDEVSLLDDVRHAPVIFQAFVPAVLDLRVAVMGDRIFATAIDSSGVDYQVDYRMELRRAEVAPYELPRSVRSAIRRLMKRLGLVYGAIDLRLTPDGSYVFLEINPAGQWRFMEERTGVPMTDAFAELLLDLEDHRQGAQPVSREGAIVAA